MSTKNRTKNRTSRKATKILNILLEVYGWAGAVTVVIAYALLSMSILPPSSLIYQLMNFIGSIGVLVISIKKRTYQPVLTNGFWTLIALISIVNIVITLFVK